MTTTAIFAFADPRLDFFLDYLEQLRHSITDDVELRIAVASDEHLGEHPEVTAFAPRTSIASMMNRLIAQAPDGPLIINEGAVIPFLSTEDLKRIEADPASSIYDLDSRRPHHFPKDSEEPLDEAEWNALEFNRTVHSDSPLSFVASRKDILHVRGFDERPAFANCRTMDLLARLQRFGLSRHPLVFDQSFAIDAGQMFPGLSEERLPLSVSLRENQKAQVQSDPSVYRNLESWSVPRDQRPVLVTVAIATKDRASYLRDSINSVLAQTFEDFELVIVGDGSSDDTREVVAGFSDDRVKYFHQEGRGISAARNLIAAHSRAYYTAVHDDDDLMLPWRLAVSLGVLDASHEASYGSWVNFDDESAGMALHITKVGFGRDLVAFSGQTPGHATWLLPTHIVREIGYDERLTSSVDHNLAVRSVMSGVRWCHSGKVLFLRRIHPDQVSQTDARRQRSAAITSRYANGFNADFKALKTMVEKGKELTFPSVADKSRLFEEFGAYLPDHLVSREVFITGLVGKKVLALDLHDRFTFIAAETDLITNRSSLELGGAEDIAWDDIVRIRALGILGATYKARLRETQLSSDEVASHPQSVQQIVQDRQIRELQRALKISKSAALMVIQADQLSTDALDQDLFITARHFSVNFGNYDRERFIMVGFHDYPSLLRFRDRLPAECGGARILLPGVREFEQIAINFLQEVHVAR